MKLLLILSSVLFPLVTLAQNPKPVPEVFDAAETYIEQFKTTIRSAVALALTDLGDSTIDGSKIPFSCDTIVNNSGGFAWIHCDLEKLSGLEGISQYDVIPFWCDRKGAPCQEPPSYGPEFRIYAHYKQNYDKLGRKYSCTVSFSLKEATYGYRIFNSITQVQIAEVHVEIPQAPEAIELRGSCN